MPEKQTNSECLWVNSALNHANACGKGFLVQLCIEQLRYLMQNCLFFTYSACQKKQEHTVESLLG